MAMKSLQLVAAVANGIAQAQAVAGAGNLTLNGSLVSGGVATMDVARRVGLVSTGAGDTTQTATLTGTDRFGNVTGEVVTLNGTTAVQSQRDYKTITQIAISAATAGNISAGTTSVGSTDWFVNDLYVTSWALAGAVSGPAGTTYTVEKTWDDPAKIGTSLILPPSGFSEEPDSLVPPHVFPDSVVNALSGDNQYNFSTGPVRAHRLTINSGTGLVIIWTAQSGIIS